MIDSTDLDKLLRNIDHLSFDKKQEVLRLLEERDRLGKIDTAREKFIPFVKAVWPVFIPGAHHNIMGEAFERVANGTCTRLIINMAPRHTKSELASWLLPAWFLGRFPTKKIIQASNTEALAAGFGRRVRNLLDGVNEDDDVVGALSYQDIFPAVRLAKDSQAAAGWHTSKGGEYFAIGVNGKVTGKGGDIVIIDDPHALATDTEIPTPDGFKTIKELQVGDEVYGPDGKPTKVLAKSPIYEDRELYRVTTNDGASIYADAAHLWSYRSDTKRAAPFVTGRTDDLVQWSKTNLPVLPVSTAPEFPARKLPIDPYILGVWLGNGTSTLGRITSHQDDVAWFRAQVDAAGYETTDQADKRNFGVIGLRAQLIDMDLYDNKHIPEAYLVASPAQRLALLQGLMDTDGHVTEQGGCSFDNTNLDLIDGVQELVRSFGARAIFKRFEGSNRKAENATIYRVNFSLPNACRLPRKAARVKAAYGKRGRSITVTPTGVRGRVQCITVAREDGLFLAGRGYVVTHNSEQEAKQAEASPEIFDSVYDWYTSGPRQRLQPGGAIIIVMTRWSKRDLTGQVIKKMIEETASGSTYTDQWEVIELPAVLDENTPTERAMWPGFWPLDTLRGTRSVLPVAKWKAQYQQQPSSEEGAIIKRESWRKWGELDKKPPGPQHARAWHKLEPPACDYILQSWDTAFTKNTRSDYSACTTWGIFRAEDEATGKTLNNIILLNAFKARMEFPELKLKVRQLYAEDQPDTLLIEAKGTGLSLVQELRAMNIPVEDFNYGRGTAKAPNDKVARANMIADVFASGYVWAPERRYADEVIEECAEFPYGDHDDFTDSVVQAMLRFRSGGFLRTMNDEDPWDEEDSAPRERKRMY